MAIVIFELEIIMLRKEGYRKIRIINFYKNKIVKVKIENWYNIG